MERLIFHVDVNSAFLSWEAARRLKDGKEDIRLIPSAIGGDREKRTGVILAKSIPAKKRGVKTGEPVGLALKKCPELFLAKPDFLLYERSSGAFMDICREYAVAVEKFSIDECFLDMSGTGILYPDPVKTAYEIKDKIRDTLGFTVNIGISTNKILSKMAGDFEKPDKVHTLFPDEVEKKMWPLDVGELFLVGSATAAKLRRAGIRTIGDLAKKDLGAVQGLLGNKAGAQLHRYARGIDESPVLSEPEKAKGYSISTTLEENVTDTETAENILLTLADSVAARMRADGAEAFCVGVTIRSDDFKNKSHQRSLRDSTDITAEIFNISRELFSELWDKKTPLRLIGISLMNVTYEHMGQTSLFEDFSRDKTRRLDKAVDSIRNRYGQDKIVRGAVMDAGLNVGKKYRAQMEMEEE